MFRKVININHFRVSRSCTFVHVTRKQWPVTQADSRDYLCYISSRITKVRQDIEFLIYFQHIASLDTSKAVSSNIKLTRTVDCPFLFIRLLHNLYFDTTLWAPWHITLQQKNDCFFAQVYSRVARWDNAVFQWRLYSTIKYRSIPELTISQLCASMWPPLITRIPVLQATNYRMVQLPHCLISDIHCHLDWVCNSC